MSEIRTLIVDDHKMFRDGIRAILEREADIELIGEAEGATDTLQLLSSLQPHVVLMDIGLEGVGGIELTAMLRKKYPDLAILALTMHAESHYILRMLEVGAAGYVLKSSGRSELLTAIRAVASGDSYYSRQVATVISAHLHRKNSPRDRQSSTVDLTRREIEVLKLIAAEYSNQEIANTLYISVRTVDTHRRNLLDKLQLKNNAGLVKYALQNGILDQLPPSPYSD